MISIPFVMYASKQPKVPLSWHHGRRDGQPVIQFVCKCVRRGPLIDHQIADDGTVTPSVWCWEGCGFHDYIKLEKYPG